MKNYDGILNEEAWHNEQKKLSVLDICSYDNIMNTISEN